WTWSPAKATTSRRGARLEREVALTEPETKVAGADGADDGVARARGIDFDPRSPEVDRLVGVVGGDLRERDLRRVVDGAVESGVGDLDGVEVHALRGDATNPTERVAHAQPVAGRVIEDVERFAVALHASHVLRKLAPRQLDAVKQQELGRELAEGLPVPFRDE